ncbi:hypothetical protein [Devosia sp. DBB001]|nr:hypothetical protein [Devosia sp. DBB001]
MRSRPCRGGRGVHIEHRCLEGVLDCRESQRGGIVCGGVRLFRHTLYNSCVG